MKPWPIDRLIWRERERRRQYPHVTPDAGMHLTFYALAPDRQQFYVINSTAEGLEEFYKEHSDWDVKWAPDFNELWPSELEVKFETFRGKIEDVLEWLAYVCFALATAFAAFYLAVAIYELVKS